MQRQAQIVIVGAGIAGSSIAYHLTKLGWSEVVLIDSGPFAGGTTSHAPGLVGQLRASASLTRLLMESVRLYETLAQEGCNGFRQVGSLRIASSRERMEELRVQAAAASSNGLPVEVVGPGEVVERFPIAEGREIEGGIWLPTDGSASAPVLAAELLRRATRAGVNAYSRIGVTGFDIANGRLTGLRTTAGPIVTDLVVLATGIWTPRIAANAGIDVPLVPMQHQVVWTEPLAGLAGRELPNLRDPDNLFYVRQDGAALAYGGYERNPAAWIEPVPAEPDPTRRQFDPPRFETIREGAFRRIPMLAEAAIERRLNGLESFTPDGGFLLGPTPQLSGLWLACGFCAHGVSGAGGVGRVMADWIAHGDPGLDVKEMDVRRFGAAPPSGDDLVRRVIDVYSDYYGPAPKHLTPKATRTT